MKIDLPKELDTEAFREAWDLWVQHRKEIKKKLTPTSTQFQLKKLLGWGERKAIAAINQSIENGWQGLFEPKVALTPSPSPNTGRGEQEIQRGDVVELSPQQKAANLRRLSEMCKKVGAL